MTNQKRKESVTSYLLVEWFAGQIPSQLLRLRFLQAIAPPERNPRRRSYHSWVLISFAVVLLLFTAPALAPRVRAANGIPRPAVAARPWPATVRVERTPEIWQVERTDAFETYSNGL